MRRYALLLLLLLAPPAAHAQRLAAGGGFACAILEDGSVKCWGRNASGALGLARDYSDVPSRGGAPGEMGDDLQAVDLGYVVRSGQVFPIRATAIAVRRGHACAILEDRSVKCWGENDYGQLGVGDTNDRGDEPGEMGANLPSVRLGRAAKAITVGDHHTCAMLDDGSVKCWGRNDHGQLGLGDKTNRGDRPGQMDMLPVVYLGAGRTATAIAAAGRHTCALLDNATVKCWGRNLHGELGTGDSNDRGSGANQMGDNLPRVNLGTYRPFPPPYPPLARVVSGIAAGEEHTCAWFNDGMVKCWGQNIHAALGIGDKLSRGYSSGHMGDALPIVNLGTGRRATTVTAGAYNTCTLLDNGSVKCWGRSDLGQLGLGDTIDRGGKPGQMGDTLPAIDLGTGRTAVAISAGLAHICALLDDGSVKCWGNNSGGELGLGDKTNRGDKPGQMGNNLPAVDLGGKVRVGVEDEAEVPGDDLALTARATAYGSITGRFAGRRGETARLGLYDLMGRRLAEQHVAGDFEIGSDLASGLYLLRVETGAQAVTRSVVVVR